MMARTIHDPVFADLLAIGAHLCEADRIELAATRDPKDFNALATDAWRSPVKYVVRDDGVPVMAYGALPIGDGQVVVWGFKTEQGWRAIPVVTKHLKRTMIPILQSQGIRSAICFVHVENTRSIKWLEYLGFKPEATLVGFGTHGEDMILYQRIEPTSAHSPGHA